ncbi:MAG: hypothetical protein JXQ67_00520 [Campylobacterales bacterium]|nr:hypothetical protein [Campylobacterales bacterium]
MRVLQAKNAIALFITLVFVMVITVALGFGLKQINLTSNMLKDENFMYQSSMVLEDILHILQNSPDVARVGDANSSTELFVLLSQASFIPIEVAGLDVVLKLSSARAKLNPNSLNTKGVEALREFMGAKGVNNQYVDILLDGMGGIKADASYNSRIFEQSPYLFRDYITSKEHFKSFNSFYAQEFNDNAVESLAFEELFYFGGDANTTIDLNFATALTWELLLSTTPQRAESLAQNAGSYENKESLGLDTTELEKLDRFTTSFFEPILFVELEISQEQQKAYINFEYDIKKKKGSNFVYEI